MRRGGPGPRGFPGAWSRPRCVCPHTRVFQRADGTLTACLGTIGGPFARSTVEPASFPSLRPTRGAPPSAYLIVTSRVDAVPPDTPHGHAPRPR